jgi:putative transposase
LRWGVQSICAVLVELGVEIAPSTYYDQVKREPGRREVRDEELKEHIGRIHCANYRVYGARKVWLALNRKGVAVARCTVERLMAELSLTGAVRGTARRTTIASTAATFHPSTSRPPTTLNTGGQPPAESPNHEVSGLTGAVHHSSSETDGGGLNPTGHAVSSL